MNIILIANNMAKPVVLELWHIMLVLTMLLVVAIGVTIKVVQPQAVSVRATHETDPPGAVSYSSSPEHVNQIALKVGEIQAKIMRLDVLSEKLAKMVGVDADLQKVAGQGGLLVAAHDSDPKQIEIYADQLIQDLDTRGVYLEILQDKLLQKKLMASTVPTGSPVRNALVSSTFGWRVDPITGKTAMHEGIDYAALFGTDVIATAEGMVTFADATPEYGNLVKIDHGQGLETRYAHASKILVHAGMRVKKGQLVAEVGSTGRSTGSHLHFEVRLHGLALNPMKYLGASYR